MIRALLLSLVVSAGKPDAGVTGPVVVSKPDAGVPVANVPGTPPPATVADLEKARKEIAELRTKVSELEARVTKAEALSRDLDALKTKMEKVEARLDAADDKREAEEQEVARKKSVAVQNAQMLSGALQALSTGNTSNVDAWLRSAEQNSSGNAQKLVQLARQSLAQQDLVATRQFISLALMEQPQP